MYRTLTLPVGSHLGEEHPYPLGPSLENLQSGFQSGGNLNFCIGTSVIGTAKRAHTDEAVMLFLMATLIPWMWSMECCKQAWWLVERPRAILTAMTAANSAYPALRLSTPHFAKTTFVKYWVPVLNPFAEVCFGHVFRIHISTTCWKPLQQWRLSEVQG